MFKVPLTIRTPRLPSSLPPEVAPTVQSKPVSRIQPSDYFLRFQQSMKPVNSKDPRILKHTENELSAQSFSLNTDDTAYLTRILRSLSQTEQDTFAQLCQQNSRLLSTELPLSSSTSDESVNLPTTPPSDPAVKLPVEPKNRNMRAQRKTMQIKELESSNR
ncbi:hypothetical protein M3Y96_00984300 [Aphelenchoides besseyi]|nr:hypothetical protein M3Y96_00984300 [Aphelenchoides besseyi]